MNLKGIEEQNLISSDEIDLDDCLTESSPQELSHLEESELILHENDISLAKFYDDYPSDTLDTRATLGRLVDQGYLPSRLLQYDDPIEVFAHPAYIPVPKQPPKLATQANSSQPEYEHAMDALEVFVHAVQ